MLYISIAITLFALMAGMFLLAKTRKEGLGKSFTWISYFVIVVSLLLVLCQGTRGVMHMVCHRGSPDSEFGMHMGACGGGCMMMHHGWMNGHGRCMEEMEICRTKMDSACCSKSEKKHGCPMGAMGEGKDTAIKK